MDPVLVVGIRTFLPSGYTRCARHTLPETVAVCFRAAATDFVKAASRVVHDAAKEVRARRVVLDLRSNTGGSVVLAAAAASHLLTGTVTNMGDYLPPVVLRRSKWLASLARWLEANQGRLQTDPAFAEAVYSFPLTAFGVHRMAVPGLKTVGARASALEDAAVEPGLGPGSETTRSSPGPGPRGLDFSWFT